MVEEASVLFRTDPFRDLDRIARQVLEQSAQPAGIALDAWREGDSLAFEMDLPGVDPGSIDLSVERNVLTIRAERVARSGANEMLANERRMGTFMRQLVLGDNLNLDELDASYEHGVLRVFVPVAEKAKPRKIAIKTAAAIAG